MKSTPPPPNNTQKSVPSWVKKPVENNEPKKVEETKKEEKPPVPAINSNEKELEKQITEHLKRIKQLEDELIKKDETIARLLEDKKVFTNDKSKLQEELRAEKEHSSHLSIERNRFEKESKIPLNDKLKTQVETLEESNSLLHKKINEFEKKYEQSRREAKNFEESFNKKQAEALGYSKEVDALKTEKQNQSHQLNLQCSEIQKLRNELETKEQEIKDKSQYIDSALKDISKGAQENEQLKKQFEAVKDAQEKLVEEKKHLLEKSNKISELELEVKDTELKSKEFQEEAKNLKVQLDKIQEEATKEKVMIDDSLDKIKEAFEILQEKVIIYGTSGVNIVQANKEEEEKAVAAKMVLRSSPKLYFVYELYQGMREKIRTCEETIRHLEEQLASKIDPKEHENLKKALADAEDNIQSINSRLFSIQREHVEKNQLMLEKIEQYSIQFGIQVKNMFMYTSKSRRSSVSFTSQLDMFSKDFPQLKNIQELHDFLKDTVKKDLDQAKASVEEKSKEIEKLKAKIAELEAQNSNLQDQVQQSTNQAHDLEKNVKDLEVKVKESYGKTTNFEGELQKRNQEKEDLNTNLKSLKEKLTEEAKQSLEKNSQLSSYASRIKELERRVLEAEGASVKFETQVLILTEDKENLIQNLDVLKEKLNGETKQSLDKSNIIAKHESAIKILEAKLEESQKKSVSLEADLAKRNKEKDELNDTVKALKEKIVEEGKETLKKANRIADLEASIQKYETKATEAEQKALNLETEFVKLKAEAALEKDNFNEQIKKIKAAFLALANAVLIPGSSQYNQEEGLKAEEQLTLSAKSALSITPDLQFIFEIYQILRGKIKNCEELIKSLEEKLAEIDELKKALAGAEKDKQDLSAQIILTQKQEAEKREVLLEKIGQFSMQFNMMIKNMFLPTRQRRSSVSFTAEVDMLSKEYPQLKNVEELQDFLRNTVKKELDETKTSLEEKVVQVDKLSEKNSEQLAEINQLKSEIEKLRNEMLSKDTEIKEKSDYISSALQDIQKGSEENEKLKQLIEAANETQKKLSEEKKTSLEKSNKITDLEKKIKELTDQVAHLEDELLKLKNESAKEKETFAKNLKEIKAAFGVIPDAIAIIPETGNIDLDEKTRKEEELAVAAELSLKNATELYFINDLYHAMREKLKIYEQRVLNSERKADKLTKELANVEKEKSTLVSEHTTKEKANTDKNQTIRDSIAEFSKQFDLQVRKVFKNDQKEHSNEINSLDTLENIGKDLPELKELRVLYKFLHETAKQLFDKINNDLSERLAETTKSQRKNSELQAQLEASLHQIKVLQEADAEKSQKIASAIMYEEFGDMLFQLLKNNFQGNEDSEAHGKLLQKFKQLAEGQPTLEFGRKIHSLVSQEMHTLTDKLDSVAEDVKQMETQKVKASSEYEKMKQKVTTLQTKVEEGEKIQREREYSDKKRETDAINMLKESEINQMKRDIATFEEFSSNFMVLLKDIYSTKSSQDSKRREEKRD